MLEAVGADNAAALARFCERDNFGCRVLSASLDAPDDPTRLVMLTRRHGEVDATFSLRGGSAVVCGWENADEVARALRFFGCQTVFAPRAFADAARLPIRQSGVCARLTECRPPAEGEPVEWITAETLREIYPLLRHALPAEDDRPFGNWYVELSHLLRHGRRRAAVIRRDGVPVSLAMTAAQTDTAAVIGPVFTLPAYRGNGYAHRLCRALGDGSAEEGKTVFLCCETHLLPFYEKAGWTACGEWVAADASSATE